MASDPTTSFSSHPRDAILADGYYKEEDATLASCAQRMDDEGVPFASREGLQFCKDVLDHKVSKSPYIPAKGHYLNFTAYTFDSSIIVQMVSVGPV